MNSLEFIEELINNIETNIYITESVLKTYDEDSDDEEEINTLKNNLEYLKERLKYSKQIKTEIEAWGIVKHSISKEHLEDCQIRTMYGENPFMNINEEDKLIIKEALEVKNE